MRSLFIVTLLLSLSACDSAEEQVTTPYKPTTEMINLMNWIMDPAADGIWLNSGWEITDQGERELFPTDEEGWQKMVNAAAMVAESGNLLMIPGRENGIDGRGEDWVVYSQAIVDTGNLLLEAAQAKDKQAVFDLGGRLYQVCLACHQRYAFPEQER